MTVKDLKKLLEECADTDPIVMSKDGEGNEFSPLADISEQMYIADCTWSGEISERELTEEMKKEGYTEENITTEEQGAVKCITLWPTN